MKNVLLIGGEGYIGNIVAQNLMSNGSIVTSYDNLTVKRPGTGLSPMGWDTVIGKAASSDYEMDDLIR